MTEETFALYYLLCCQVLPLLLALAFVIRVFYLIMTRKPVDRPADQPAASSSCTDQPEEVWHESASRPPAMSQAALTAQLRAHEAKLETQSIIRNVRNWSLGYDSAENNGDTDNDS